MRRACVLEGPHFADVSSAAPSTEHVSSAMRCLTLDAAALGCSTRRRACHTAAAPAVAAPAARRSRKAPVPRAQPSPASDTAATPDIGIDQDEARQKMYQPKYGGEGAPEWNSATCTASQLVLPDTRVVTLDVRSSGVCSLLACAAGVKSRDTDPTALSFACGGAGGGEPRAGAPARGVPRRRPRGQGQGA